MLGEAGTVAAGRDGVVAGADGKVGEGVVGTEEGDGMEGGEGTDGGGGKGGDVGMEGAGESTVALAIGVCVHVGLKTVPFNKMPSHDPPSHVAGVTWVR